MPVEIRVRYSTGTYTARAKGHKQTASCTISARDAAEALARKLGLDPTAMRYTTDLGGKHFDTHVFDHPGEAVQQAPHGQAANGNQ